MLKRILICAALISAALSGCAAPQVHHVGSASVGLFFDVPRNWSSVEESLLKKAETGWNSSDAGSALVNSLTWQTAWSASPVTSPNDFFANTASDTPLVYASARTLYSAEKAGIVSDYLAALQDVVLPVSAATAKDGLSVDVNRSFVFSGRQGVEQQLRWTTGGVEQKLRASILLSKDESTLFVVTARCSVKCFANYENDISSILNSITIKEPSGA